MERTINDMPALREYLQAVGIGNRDQLWRKLDEGDRELADLAAQCKWVQVDVGLMCPFCAAVVITEKPLPHCLHCHTDVIRKII